MCTDFLALLSGGCGCQYPEYVDPGVVSRSDQIVGILGKTAKDASDETVAWLKGLPLSTVLRVGGCRIGVVHGDPDSLAGWGLGVEMMLPLDAKLRDKMKVSDMQYTSSGKGCVLLSFVV